MAEGRHIQELMIFYEGGENGALTLAGSAVEAKVGASRMVGRKSLSVFNFGTGTIYWAWKEAQANADDGFPMLTQTGLTWAIDDQTQIFLFGAGNVRIQEGK